MDREIGVFRNVERSTRLLLEFQCEAGLLLRCDGKAGMPLQTKQENYALLPIWNYKYRYRGKEYQFRLNGETGKMVGKAPISVGKLIGCAATVFSLVTAMGYMLRMILEVF